MRARWRWAADSPRVAGVALTAPCAWLKCSQAGRNYVALTTQRSETPPSTQAAVSTQCRQMGLRARRDTQHSSSRNIDGDMLRATYRPVAGFPDLRVLRPAPTAARPPTPLPGFAGYRRGIASRRSRRVAGPRRLSRVPRTTIRTFNAQYAGGFLSAHSWNQDAFHGLRRHTTGSAPSFSARRRLWLTTLTQASLALQTARSIPPRFAPSLSTTHGGITTEDPGVSPDRTHTGRPP